MSNKNKILGTLKIKRSASEQVDNKKSSPCADSKEAMSTVLTDEEALSLGIRSLSKVCNMRKAITEKEQWALASMVSYVADKQKSDEETVRSILLAHLNVDEMEDIPCGAYDRAICYLVDFELSKILN